MSHSLLYVVEIKDKDSWKTVNVFNRPSDFDKTEYPDKVIKIGEEDYMKTNLFDARYLTLRDYYFGSHPWKGSDIFKGKPSDIDKETTEILEDWIKGGYKIYSCTMAEIEAESEKVFKEWKEQEKHEDIMNFSTDFARRLGYGKEGSENYYEDPEDKEAREDLLYIVKQFDALKAEVMKLAELEISGYWIDENNVRIIIWTD